ncbi:PucR family transcriptional regulator [Amycolatopsis sp. NPDC059657]|uniref:PucR family transcriptional regulator n=1 Tax=Amycolatopsis sp. NPDC059657 TaxID=3346899 RepID=UPI0036707AE4
MDFVTDHKPGSLLSVAGVPIHDLLARRLAELVSRILVRIQAEVAAYRTLPIEELRGDIAAIAQDVLRAFIRGLREDRGLNAEELDQVSRSAARRAEEGFPLEAVLSAYHVGVREILRTASAGARPDDLPDVLASNERALRFLEGITAAVTSGYLDEVRTKVGQEHNARRSLLAALLDGGQADAVFRSAGIMPPARYLVLSLAVGPHPDEAMPGVDAAIALRRKVRRLLAELDHATAGSALSSVDGVGGIVLVPTEMSEVDWARWTAVIERAGRSAGAPITAAIELAEPAAVPSAATRTADVLDVVRWFDRPPGLYRLDDILVEYQLTRPGVARDRLAALLEPLAAHPDLLETVRCYLAHDLNRRRTASLLHVHPNTVDYRLRRIHELTGIDPTHPAGIPRITAALAARQAKRP